MRGTSRPSDTVRRTGEKQRNVVGATPKHGDRLGTLVVEGVPFRDDKRRLRVHVRCTVHGTSMTKIVYHLVRYVNPGCPQCQGRRWRPKP